MMALFTAHDFKTAFLTVLSNFLTTYLPAQGEIEAWEAKGWWYMLDSLEIGPDSEHFFCYADHMVFIATV